MFAIVETQQQPPVSEGGDKAGKRVFGTHFQTKHRRDGADDQTGIVEWREINQPCAMLVGGDHLLGNGECKRGLADPTGANDRHQALARKSGS